MHINPYKPRVHLMVHRQTVTSNQVLRCLLTECTFENLNEIVNYYPATLKDTYFVIYGIISEFTDKGNFTSLPGEFQYLTLLRGLQGGLTCKFDQVLSTAKNLSIGYYFA